MTERGRSLLQGAYDLHVHPAPDLLPRKLDDIEMARRAAAAGMRGFAIKSHFFATAERAQNARRLYPEVNAVGTITLNNSVGGINPIAVEMAARAGARIVWFPTTDSELERDQLPRTPPERHPYWARAVLEMQSQGIVSPVIRVVEDGAVRPAVHDVLDVIARHQMILATGHLSKADTYTLVKTACDHRVERIVVTHVDFPSMFHSVDDQRALLRFGAYLEHCFTTPTTGKVTWDVVVDQIRSIGPEHVVLTTDLGQPQGSFPDEGLALFAERLLTSGISETDVRKMIVDHPTALVE